MRESRETDEVLVCMAQRLQSQLERQLTLVERLQSTSRDDESLADLSDLRSCLLRSLRGSENLLVLGGAQQGPRTRGPRSMSEVLTEARAGVEDVSRVQLDPAPQVGISPRAGAALVALFTELLTHALTVAPPGSRVEVTGHRGDDGGVTVEVVTEGPGPTSGELDDLNRRLADRPVIDDIVSNRVGLFVAARLARRSGALLRVQHRRGGALPATGLVTVVHCPPDLLDGVDLVVTDAPSSPSRRGTGNGNGYRSNGNGNGADGHRPAPPRRPDPLLDPLLDPLPQGPPAPPPVTTFPTTTFPPPRRTPPRTDVPQRAPWDDVASSTGGADELFGPMTGSLRDRMREAGPTPIYEAVASAWFVEPDPERSDGRQPDTARRRGAAAPPADWNTPSDAEWRAASQRAARPGPEQQQDNTSAGLPRRRPGTQMVAPPRHGTPAPPNGSTEREPERVRERLAVYQQGLERGRHRAADEG